MLKPLDVNPEHLTTTGAGLTAAQVAASMAITASSAAIVPGPAGADDVSIFAAAAFGGFAPVLMQAVSGGLGNHLAGAQALPPTAAEYQAADASSAAAVNAQGSTFA